MRQVKAFLYLNQLKVKYQQKKGLKKAMEYMNRLHVAATRTKIQKRQLAYLLSKAITPKDKTRVIRYFLARLFLQKTYAFYERYNPFTNKNPSVAQVKRFIADCL